ncbi:MAG: hypothetical protein GWP91_03635 [Rhodobacterales bacterium]|nr:hypothetical protein [Rhodobacterales bacterium]
MRSRSPSPSPAFQSGFQIPSPLTLADWRLAPLHPKLAQVDYQAWRSCRERLVRELQWNGWPGPDFSLADNVADLANHYAEFQQREAFAYSVLTTESCIGCVYIEPWKEGAQLAFWVVDEALPIEGDVVTGVLDWLELWPFERVVVPLRPYNLRGRGCLESLGMAQLVGPDLHVSYARPCR